MCTLNIFWCIIYQIACHWCNRKNEFAFNYASQVSLQQRIHLPMQEMQIQSLSQEDSLEEEMATHSSILVWKMPWTVEPGGLQSIVSQRVRHYWSHWACTFNYVIKNMFLKWEYWFEIMVVLVKRKAGYTNLISRF